MIFKYIAYGRKSCGWTPVRMMDGSGYTYLHEDGHLMEHRFKEAAPFVSDMAVVRVFGQPEDKNYTYVTKDGKLASLCFNDVEPFKEGATETNAYIGEKKYTVNQDGLCYVIDAKPIIEAIKRQLGITDNIELILKAEKKMNLPYEIIGGASEDMVPVKMKDGSGFTYMYLDTFDVMDLRFKNLTPFDKGLALVELKNGVKCFVDKKQSLFDKQQVEDVLDDFILKETARGLQAAKEAGKVREYLLKIGYSKEFVDEVADLDNLEELLLHMSEYDDEDEDEDEIDDYDDQDDYDDENSDE